MTVDHNAERGHREEDRAGGEVPCNPGGSFAPSIEGPFRETTDDATNDAANSGDDAANSGDDAANSGDDATETSNQVCAQRAPVTAEVDADDLLAWQQRLACPTGNHPPVVQKRKTHGHAPREESPPSPRARGDGGHRPFVIISSHPAAEAACVSTAKATRSARSPSTHRCAPRSPVGSPNARTGPAPRAPRCSSTSRAAGCPPPAPTPSSSPPSPQPPASTRRPPPTSYVTPSPPASKCAMLHLMQHSAESAIARWQGFSRRPICRRAAVMAGLTWADGSIVASSDAMLHRVPLHWAQRCCNQHKRHRGEEPRPVASSARAAHQDRQCRRLIQDS